MKDKFQSFISQNDLLLKGERVLLAVSGGLDSMVLLHLFKESTFDFGIAHCNFQLRGKESNEDSEFVKSIAERWSIPYFSSSFQTEEFAKDNQISIQMAARTLRYDWFEKIRMENNYHKIVIAHHKNDNTETFLINLIRGTGIAGLHGIRRQNNRIIRPLLDFSREELESYAEMNQIEWREDSSNSNSYYLRNKLRLSIIPELKKLNPEFETHINRLSWEINEVEQLKEKWLKRKSAEWLIPIENGHRLSIDLIRSYSQGIYFLQQTFKKFGFSFAVIEDIIASMDAQSGNQFYSETHRVIKDRDFFIVSTNKAQEESVYWIDEDQKTIEMQGIGLFAENLKEMPNRTEISKSEAFLDKEKLQFPLQVRRWEVSDKFQPLGMKGSKKLSDFFIDEKFTLLQKENTFVLLSGTEIVWVIGHRIDERYKVSEQCKTVYHLLKNE